MNKSNLDPEIKSTNRVIKTKGPLIFTFLVVLIVVLYLYFSYDDLKQLFNFSFEIILILILLVLAFLINNGMTNYFFYRAMGMNVTWNEGLGLASVNTFANLLPFSGGIIFKSVYLNKKYDFPYSSFLSSIFVLYVCFVSINGLLGLSILVVWWIGGNFIFPIWLALGFFCMLMSILILWLPFERILINSKVYKILKNFVEGWKILRSNLRLLGILLFLQILNTILFAYRYYFSFRSLSQHISFFECLLFSSSTILTRIVSFAPGGLGVREGIVAGLASVLGYELNASVAALSIDRLISTIVIIIFGTIYTYALSKNLSENL